METKSKRARIAVLDDEPAFLDIVRLLLGESYEVSCFDDPYEFLKRLTAGMEPDLLILDVHMPKMNGFEVCRRIRARLPFLPILFLTASLEEKDRLRGADSGANCWLNKPIGGQALRAEVEQILGFRENGLARFRGRDLAAKV